MTPHVTTTDAVRQFADAIRSAGIAPPAEIVPDGKLRRFAATGKRGDDAGWYVLHGDGIPAGSFGDWRGGTSETWRADIGRRLTADEEAAHRARIEAIRRVREAEDAKRKAEARERAAALWHAATPAPDDHPYLAAKGVRAHGIRVHDGSLIIPMRDGTVIHSLQFIDREGEKRFLTGGRVQGCYFPIGKPSGAICIAEGFATGASVHEATGHAVAIAFNAGNLLPVAQAMRQKFPDARLIVCADDDQRSAGNPGIAKATEAARAVGGLVAVPNFGADRPEGATDFNDLHRAHGAEAVKRAIERAGTPSVQIDGPRTDRATARDPVGAPSLIVVSGDSVTPMPIRWLWGGWIAQGKLHILAGAPGTGKTSIALALAATITTGGRWPDGTRASVGSVLIASFEDDVADTLVPRLRAAGADMSRVHFITGVREPDGTHSLDAARHAGLVAEAITKHAVTLVIVDPLISAMGTFDSHRNAETRQAMQPFADLAMQTDIAFIGIAHFAKGTAGRDPLERVSGSLAFGALARVVLGAAKVISDHGEERRLFIRIKSNIGPDDGGYVYSLNQIEAVSGVFASRVLWGEAVEGAARELLATADGVEGDGGTVADAKRFLTGLLADGPMSSKVIRADADGAGYSWATIRRAQKALAIEAVKEGMKSGWVWRMPARQTTTDALGTPKMLRNDEDAQQKELSAFGEHEHLRPTDADADDVIEERV
jgi:putative DNA primase/helicase